MKTFDLSGYVGMEITPAAVKEMLDSAGGEDITINLASIGGYVYDGFQVFNQFKDYPGRKVLVINGIAASMAAYISTAFDEIKVKDNSTFMIHNTQGGAIGDYRVLDKEAKELKRLNSVIGQAYVNRSGRGMAEVLGMMDEETWMYGKEIVDAGFADELIVTASQSDRAAALKAAREKVAAFRPPVKSDDIQRAASLFPHNQNSSGVAGRNNQTGGNFMDKKSEVFETLKVMITNAQVTLPEIAGAIGLKHLIVTEEHTAALKVVKDLKEKLGTENVVDAMTTMKAELDNGRETVRNARLDSLFDPQTEDKTNRLRYYMGQQTIGLTGKALEDKIAALKAEDPIAQGFMAERADNTSQENTIGLVDHKDAKKPEPENKGGQRVVEM